jgi:hypothetical protein
MAQAGAVRGRQWDFQRICRDSSRLIRERRGEAC